MHGDDARAGLWAEPTCWRVLIQQPVSIALTKLVLVFHSFLDFNLGMELMLVAFAQSELHRLWLPCWIGERASEIDWR